jgi:hypothetical protein
MTPDTVEAQKVAVTTGTWDLGPGSWELGAGSWELGPGTHTFDKFDTFIRADQITMQYTIDICV